MRAQAPAADPALFVGLLYFTLNLWVSYPLSMPERALAFWILVGLLAPLRSPPAAHATQKI